MAEIRIFDTEHCDITYSHGALHIQCDKYSFRFDSWPQIGMQSSIPNSTLGITQFFDFCNALATFTFDSSVLNQFRLSAREIAAAEEWQKSIPDSVKTLISGFICEHWYLLEGLSHTPELEKLTADHPFLGFMAINLHKYIAIGEGQRNKAIQKYVSLKRREQLKTLGLFQPSNAMVRIVNRIEPSALMPNTGHVFRHLFVFSPEIIKPLSHRKESITKRHVTFLQAFQGRLKPISDLNQFMNSISTSDLSVEALCEQYDWVTRLSDELSLPIPPIRDTTHLAQVQHELNDKILHGIESGTITEQQVLLHDLNNTIFTDFPQVPFAGDERIKPVVNTSQLLKLSKTLNNCLATYQSDILKKDRFIYQIGEHRKGAICLERVDGKWRLGECSGKDNHPLPDETTKVVEEWWKRCRNNS